MALGKAICKVCGASYPHCFTPNNMHEFRWQDIACCPEHGATFFNEILKSRGDDRVIVVKNGETVVDEKAVAKIVRKAKVTTDER